MGPGNKKKQSRAKVVAPQSTCVDKATATPVTATAPIDNTSSAVSATRIEFRNFIELADLKTIRIFITAASSSPEGENLKLLWARAYKEGLIAGHALYGKTEEKLKEVQDRAYETEGRRDEQEDWLIDGHAHCTRHPFEKSGTQMDSKAIQTSTPYATRHPTIASGKTSISNLVLISPHLEGIALIHK
jgi:hypothetical protein